MSDFLDIHALADGELAGSEKDRVLQAIQSDPALKAEYETIMLLKKTVREKTVPMTSASSWNDCRTRLAELDKKHRVEGFVGRYAWAMCASVFIFVVGMGLYNRQMGGSRVGTGDVAKIMSGLTPLSRPVAQPQDMSSWIRDVSRGATVQNANQFQISRYAEGVDAIGRPAAAFQMSDAVGPFSLLIVKGADRVDGVEPMVGNTTFFAGRVGDSNCLMWVEHGFGLTLIGDRTYDELARLAESLRR